MKKSLLLLGVALLLTACATSGAFTVQNCIIDGCDIAAVHHHAIY